MANAGKNTQRFPVYARLEIVDGREVASESEQFVARNGEAPPEGFRIVGWIDEREGSSETPAENLSAKDERPEGAGNEERKLHDGEERGDVRRVDDAAEKIPASPQ